MKKLVKENGKDKKANFDFSFAGLNEEIRALAIDCAGQLLLTLRNESSMRKNKKRIKSDDNLNIIKEAASIIGHEISKASLEFSKAIGVEVASQIVRDHEMTDLFFSLDENDREVMVMGFLGGKF
ncbi:hypothetical protein LIER_32913 [Lithospermum erythrorhizon]|uniref:Uncharacterized protein n=1 Tax=Lithospermum erythrorhizon TaxID=34254 RepID=A0AAV3RYC5_LITER